MNNIFSGASGLVTMVIIIILIILTILWIALPFAVFGIKAKIDSVNRNLEVIIKLLKDKS